MHTIVIMESCMGMGWLFLVCCHFLLFHFSFSHSLLCDPHDSFALLQFKTSFTVNTTFYDDPFYYNYIGYQPCHQVYRQKTATWENGTDCCSWDGVTCHPISGHVIGLDLSCNGIQGVIHSNSTLFHVSHLQSLNFAFNDFSYSQFSSLIGGFVSLTHLNLSYSNFEGEIPRQISYLSKLQSLDLSFNNQLKWRESSWKRLLQNATVLRELVLDETDMSSTSMRPLNMSSSLVTLSLVHTRPRGKLTNDFLCLPHLQELRLSENSLEEQLPNLSCSAASLRILDLLENTFQGSIPSSFSNLTHLTSLDLSSNNLNGPIPASFSNLTHLTSLDLSYNNLNGSIPASFSNLTHLTSLYLSYNYLNGSIPSSLLTLPRLTSLYLGANYFSGQIPNVFRESNKFEELGLSDNKFEGELPSTLSNLQHLIYLDLSWNKLSSQIPSSLFNFPQLSELYFSYNKLEGPLPDKITGFSNATRLWFNNNFLNGTIPSWCLSLPSLVDLDLSFNQFTGQIPAISSHSLQYLRLCYNKLQGNIPESILNLVNLIDLCLSSNNFGSPIKFSFFSNVSYNFSFLETLHLSSLGLTEFPNLSGKFPMLIELDLSINKLNGTVPKWLHEMDSLKFLNLSQNLLTAQINQFSRNYQLIVLDISFNLLTGGISSSFCNASSIEILNLSHNKLTSIIPSCLANSSSLSVLDLQMNNLDGILPSTFSKNNQLAILNLNDNQLEGPMTESLSNCTSLEVLNLGNNQIEDIFPHWLQTIPSLRVLVLRANKLRGSISSLKTKHGFSSLVIFDISSNNFSGPIPKAYVQNFVAMKDFIEFVVRREDTGLQHYMETYAESGLYIEYLTLTTKSESITFNKVPTNLVIIDLSNNKFVGEIPNVIGELHALKGLNLFNNRLSGPIPQSLGNLTNLESLDLSSNMLTGKIPTKLVNLNFLEFLNLSHNQLMGEIPQGKQFDTFSNNSYEGNLGLCGVPLSVKCSNDPEQHSPASENMWREERFGFGWKPVAIGYGCGMIFGVGLGCSVLLIGKPKWLVRIVGNQR